MFITSSLPCSPLSYWLHLLEISQSVENEVANLLEISQYWLILSGEGLGNYQWSVADPTTFLCVLQDSESNPPE